MNILLVSTIILASIHLLVPYLYNLLMQHIAKKPWNVKQDQEYQPEVTLIVPTYNESSFILKKLENMAKLDYPPDKLEVIIVDSASTDSTLYLIKEYLRKADFPFEIKVLEENERRGKAKALNYALEHAKNPIIAISDADAYWEPSALKKALPYLADTQVGAVTGREKFLNENQNFLTRAEGFYRKIYYNMRTGESKLHSTLIFQGELSIFKRSVLKEFTTEKGSDDTGTVKNIISEGYRTLFVPEAIFFDIAPYNWKDWISVKSRRSLHLLWVLADSMKLKLKKKFPLPKLILYTNFFIHVINPIMGLILLFSIICLAFSYPLILGFILPPFLFAKFRTLFFYFILAEIASIIAILSYLKRDEKLVWKKWRV